MKIVQHMIILSLLTVWSRIEGQQQEEELCAKFQLTEQPPKTLGCNPYHMTGSGHVWRLRTSCAVRRTNTSIPYHLHWFHRSSNDNTVVDMGQPEFSSSTNDNNERVLFGNQLSNQHFTDNMLGEYWCQVVVNTGGVYYGPAGNTVTIHPPNSYSTGLPVCSGTRAISAAICVDTPTSLRTTTSDTPTFANLTNNTTTTNVSPSATDSSLAISTNDTSKLHTIVNTTNIATSILSYFSSTDTSQTSSMSHSVLLHSQTTQHSQSTSITPHNHQHQHNQSIEDRRHYEEGRMPVEIIVGIAVLAIALAAAIVLFCCIVVLLATPKTTIKTTVVEKISRSSINHIFDTSLMKNNPLYPPVAIRHNRETGDCPINNRKGTREATDSVARGNGALLGDLGVVMTRSEMPQTPTYANIEICRSHESSDGKTKHLRRLLSTRTKPQYMNVGYHTTDRLKTESSTQQQEIQSKEALQSTPQYENIGFCKRSYCGTTDNEGEGTEVPAAVAITDQSSQNGVNHTILTAED